MLRITRESDVNLQTAMPQLQAGRILSVHLKILFASADRMVALSRYDPGLVVAPHRHAGVEVIYVLDGSMAIDGVDCVPGTLIVLDEESTIGPIVAGDQGTLILEVFTGAGSWNPQFVETSETYESLVKQRMIVELPGAGRK